MAAFSVLIRQVLLLLLQVLMTLQALLQASVARCSLVLLLLLLLQARVASPPRPWS